MRDTVRIGCYAAFWGDTGRAAGQQLRGGGDLQYLVSDYLAEITMALLARARAKDPQAGYVGDTVTTLVPILGELHERGIRVVTNGGALNPAACAAALRAAAREAGLPLRVAAVTGDDLLDRAGDERAAGAADMFTGEPLPAGVSSMNAYLGARPIADALDAGADIVVTGRCVDAAVVLGPLMHEFGWRDEDQDLLSAGSLIGHILECGPQCAGGIHTDWDAVPGWEDMGYPIAECRPDGTATIAKPQDTGGRITPATVGEQVLYEIGDPGAYVMADVVCDWRDVRLEQEGPDRVAVSGARGAAATTTYKVTATGQDGYRSLATAMFAGIDAAGRARRAGEALVTRVELLLERDGWPPLSESSVEVIGGGDVLGDRLRPDTGLEAVLKVGVRHPDRDALQVFSSEFAPMSLVAQGMTGIFAGRPRVAPVFRVHHVLVDKSSVPVHLVLDDDGAPRPVTVSLGERTAVPGTAQTAAPTGGDHLSSSPPPVGRTVPLRRVAWGRSGDKGDKANIGLIARHPDLVGILRDQVTPARVADFFGHYLTGDVARWEVPGLNAFNYLLDGVLGGTGGTSTLRYDPQAKSYGAMLLTLGVVVPRELDALLTPGPDA